MSAVWDPATGHWSEPEAVPLAPCVGYPEPIPAPNGRVLWWGSCNQGVAIVGPVTTMGETLLGFPTTSPFGAGAKAR